MQGIVTGRCKMYILCPLNISSCLLFHIGLLQGHYIVFILFDNYQLSLLATHIMLM